jgi:H+/Cl- antiporter ClcA
MSSPSPPDEGGPASRLGAAVLGAVLGGLAGGFFVVGVTIVLKAGIDFASRQGPVFVAVVPLCGLALATLVLHGFGRAGAPNLDRPIASVWRTFPPDAARADISRDVVETAGQEERFPWHLAPIRAAAILTTVGMGGAMGTEAPAAYLGVAIGACLGDRGRRWRRLLRPAALAGGAAGVGALMGIALVGTAFMLELGHRNRAPLSAERLIAALLGGFLGWGIDTVFGLSLIRLVVPHEAPTDLLHAGITALFIGAASGVVSSAAAIAVYRAKTWQAPAAVRLALGGAAVLATTLVLTRIASPSAAVGPGGGAILWAENVLTPPLLIAVVCVLRAVATSATVAAGGCGGVFVPFLAIGDLAGRVFAPGLRIGDDLSGAAGAAGGIAAGYRLPVTAALMVLGVGGPPRAVWTSLATIVVAFLSGTAVQSAYQKLRELRIRRRRAAH